MEEYLEKKETLKNIICAVCPLKKAVKLSTDIAIGSLSMSHCYSVFSSLSSASALI